MHAERGVDAVPVAYAVDDGYLEADPRATLLVEHWTAATGHGCGGAGRTALAGRYPQYQDHPFVRGTDLHIVGLAGWAADDR
jgi:hypothetical protein